MATFDINNSQGYYYYSLNNEKFEIRIDSDINLNAYKFEIYKIQLNNRRLIDWFYIECYDIGRWSVEEMKTNIGKMVHTRVTQHQTGRKPLSGELPSKVKERDGTVRKLIIT